MTLGRKRTEETQRRRTESAKKQEANALSKGGDLVGASRREATTEAELCLVGCGGFTYVVARLRYIVYDDETFRYELMPNYDVIDLLNPRDFQGIPGFDLSKRKACYVRENRTPMLIADRAPMRNREDLWQLLEECGMDYWDPVEWLIRSPRRYIGDGLFFRAPSTEGSSAFDVNEVVATASSTSQAVDVVLTAIAEGRKLEGHGEELGFAARRSLYDFLMLLHEKRERGRRTERGAAGEDSQCAAGRKRKPIDELMLREAMARYRDRQWTAQQAADYLEVSVPTFYRRMAEWEARG